MKNNMNNGYFCKVCLLNLYKNNVTTFNIKKRIS